MKARFRSTLVVLASAAVALAGTAPVFAAGKGGGARAGTGSSRAHHHNGRARVGVGVGVGVGIGVGLGFGRFYDPFFDPYYPYGYPVEGGYVYAPQPAAPCTAADVPKSAPTNNPFSPDFAYDRIDASRCTPQAVAEAQAAQQAPGVVAPPAVQQPGAFYFCRSTNAYYPYVSTCAEGWQQVEPRPPGG